MSDAFEKKVLSQVLAQLDSGQMPTQIRSRWWSLLPSLLLWIGVFSVAMLYMSFGRPVHWTDLLVCVAALGLGYYWSYRWYRTSYDAQWPVLAPHFDRTQIENRLRELGA